MNGANLTQPLAAPLNSSRYPQAELTAPGTRPTLLETLATTGGYPIASSTGKVMRVPDPITALMVPAPNPAAMTAMISRADKGGSSPIR